MNAALNPGFHKPWSELVNRSTMITIFNVVNWLVSAYYKRLLFESSCERGTEPPCYCRGDSIYSMKG